MLIARDLLRLTLMLCVVTAVAAGGPVEVVIPLTALASAAGSAERPAALALMPRLVGESRLGAGNALLHTVQELGVVVGPAIGATLVNARLAAARRVSLVVVATAVATCATQFVFAGTSVLVIALGAVVIGGAALVSCEVVAETALARTVQAEALGRVVGVFDAASIGAMVAGAVLAPIAIAATSLETSLVVLGGASIAVALLGRLGLRGLDAATARRSDELASRVGVIAGLPIAAALPRTIVERLASASQLCASPAGVDVVVQGAPAHALFAIVDGAAVVQRNGVRVDRMGAGEVFGERGLLDNAPRNATVTTDSDATLLRIDGEALLEALQAVPAMRPALDIGGRDDRGASARTADPLDGPAGIDGATVVVVGAGWPGKRRIYERMAQLGARIVIVDERGHWSERLVEEGVAARWLAAPVTGDADVDARAVLDVLRGAGEQPNGS